MQIGGAGAYLSFVVGGVIAALTGRSYGGRRGLARRSECALQGSKTFFGGPDGDGLNMQFDFIGMQNFYLSLARGDARPLAKALRQRPPLDVTSQWANFVRNHDELTLDKLNDIERQEVFDAFGPDPGMQLYGRGLRRRLPSMLGGDERRMRMAYSLAFSLPGTPLTRRAASTSSSNLSATDGCDFCARVRPRSSERANLGAGVGPLKRWWLYRRLADVAALEHFTAVLCQWVLQNRGLDYVGANPVMLDLLRWHGAEEVEHRSLVFDVYQNVCGSYWVRAVSMLMTAPLFVGWWIAGARYLMAQDPTIDAEWRWRDWLRAARRYRLPGPWNILFTVPIRYMRPSHRPDNEASTQMAMDYLEHSPAAQAARERAHRQSTRV